VSVHLTEEEQVEIFKRWWAANGTRIILAVLAAITLYWGLTQWQVHTEQLSAEASTIYSEMIDTYANSQGRGLDEQQTAEISVLARQLKADYNDTQYARYAGLMLAKLAVEQQSYDAAIAELNWVQANGVDEGLDRVVTLRKARVEIARGDLEAALALLESVPAEEMTSIYAETRGDIYVQLGNLDAARSAYQEAVTSVAGDPANGQILELKLNRVTPVDQDVVDVVVEEMVEKLSTDSAE